jgi:HK97 family phage portal protein
MLSGRTPIFSQFGGDVYSYDVVQQAIECIASEMSKLTPQHIRKDGADSVPVPGQAQTVLAHPNPTMTSSDFLEKITYQLFLTYNCFIIPEFDGDRKLRALWPVQPKKVEFQADNAGELFIKLEFNNNYETTLKYSDVIHIRHKFAVNELMGGNKSGNPDLDVLLQTVELNHNLLNAVSEAVKSSFAVNAVVKYNTILDKGQMDANLKDLQERLNNNESGFLGMDLKGEFIPIKKDIQLVDDKTLEFIDSKILRHFGVSLPILTGDYTKDQYEAFYQKTLEPLVIKLSQAFTKCIFTEKELSFGNKITFLTSYLVFMKTEQKLEMIRLLGDAGSLYENEKRIAFGLMPLPELQGIRMQSLNYVNVEHAKEYQLGKLGGTEPQPKEGNNE